jgi:two-component system, LuxR family, response regulator FixJ
MSFLVHIVDDDEALRDSLSALLTAHGHESRSYSSAREFLHASPDKQNGCMLIDVNMPAMNGIELLEELGRIDCRLPCIMMTGQGQVSTAVRAMKAGAIDFIEKPFESKQLLECIGRAAKKISLATADGRKAAEAAARVSALTPRERDVLLHLMRGQPNKIIAHELGISPRTVEVHRARLIEKLSANNVADAVRTAVEAGFTI